jgi:hypothetical protein
VPLATSHLGRGFAHSPSEPHGVAEVHSPTPAVTFVQVCPVGQPLRGLGPQPGTQKPPVPLQTRPESAAPQDVSSVQPQMPRSTRHAGASGVQRLVLVAVHSAQAPARAPVLRHSGRSGSGQLGAPSAVQATQVRVVDEQSGLTPPQSAAPRQPTQTPTPVAVSHLGSVVGQCEVSVAVQAAQAPLGRQMGVAGSQSAFPAQARQVCAAASQTGVVPLHWAFETQATQVPEGA